LIVDLICTKAPNLPCNNSLNNLVIYSLTGIKLRNSGAIGMSLATAIEGLAPGPGWRLVLLLPAEGLSSLSP
jgi:hypothetical protein